MSHVIYMFKFLFSWKTIYIYKSVGGEMPFCIVICILVYTDMIYLQFSLLLVFTFLSFVP